MSIDDNRRGRSSAGGNGEARPIAHPGRRRATKIEDVAAIVGVSASTVSRALARPDRVLPETRQKILDAVRLTGYTPNVAARSLRAARSMNVLVVLSSPPKTAEGHLEAVVTPFFSELLLGIDLALSEHGYAVLLGNLYDSRQREERIVNLVTAGQVDGVLLLLGRMPHGSRHSLEESGIPMVGVTTAASPDLPVVMVDDAEAARTVARHLLDLGHRRFGYVTGPAWHPIEHVRFGGFLETLQAAGIPADAVTRYDGDFRLGSGSDAAKVFLQSAGRPTAVFAISDEMAIGFMKEIRTAGLSVPADVSLVGFDGIPFADYCEPPLTTVRQPREVIGRQAAEMLLRLMRGERLAADERVVKLDAELRVGGSTARP
ncbi:MAG TPA: LacI family DNA-binding transcriptional regulator [Geminicoccus sp.]|jgi:LacI family repressor for deo operon, udp, cdd, tsx, nupC, and nupG|uniref:LacI family DNA-binding transcriptional regulator n=1 Tax=Geminicoccus sp. TaxID=2024832 RepID=UPI002E32FFF0|nr:LacI family DNA-binding transcriptional regulator [Geminicoccus sp.]HEX2529597.1 LacI family DNA-binding transcriptional regulator [Geminicoccus sp.]